MLDQWADSVKQELGLDLDLDIDEILDLARVAAHEIERPAAPLTAFLVGYAAALRHGGKDVIRELSTTVKALAERAK